MHIKRNKSYLGFMAFLIGFGITSLIGLPALTIYPSATVTLIGIGLLCFLVAMLKRLYAV